MKIKIVLLVFILLGTVLPCELIAQNPANPDLTRMRLLLAKIADCNADIEDAQAEIAAFKKINSEASLELYNQLKKNVAIAKKCKAASQREYDDLKADYEGWFKSSTSAMMVDRQRVTPVWLGTYFGQMVMAHVRMQNMFNGIVVPAH